MQLLKLCVLAAIVIAALIAISRADDKLYDSRGVYQGAVAWSGNTGLVISSRGVPKGSISRAGDTYNFYDTKGSLQFTACGDNAVKYIMENSN